ncbi:type II toxin-antitoxin system ParD family antitoxin [Aquisphaera insulae]|uniref:type II toxin-antitoxin system ParD family antitoxin n=1 Tax=Aquisphaera insulae TaxID=2712864 RepID=UPI0013EBABA1
MRDVTSARAVPFVVDKVGSGSIQTASEVIRDGLRLLKEKKTGIRPGRGRRTAPTRIPSRDRGSSGARGSCRVGRGHGLGDRSRHNRARDPERARHTIKGELFTASRPPYHHLQKTTAPNAPSA